METGTVVVVVAVALGLATAFLLRRRLPSGVVAVLLASAGAGIAWGGMLLQPDPSIGEAVAGILTLTLLIPAHVRIVLGPFGPARRGV